MRPKQSPEALAATEVIRVAPSQWLQGEKGRAMDFLNGIAGRFPSAVSLAAGRPPDELIGAQKAPDLMRLAIEITATATRTSTAEVWTRFGQYSNTNGMIEEACGRLLSRLEGIDPRGLWFQITNGIQEALTIECVRAAGDGGAVIAYDPTYVGLTGAAAIAGLPMYVIPRTDDPARALELAALAARRDVAGPLLCYLIPDHDNPTGLTLTLEQRLDILQAARKHDLLILEDTAYRLFNYDEARIPSLLALDESARVVQLCTFSKTFLPGARAGYTARRLAGQPPNLFARLTAIKSFTTVATSPLSQAVVAGFLHRIGYDLDTENATRRQFCRRNRDVVHDVLLSEFPDASLGVEWTVPRGGFFASVSLPVKLRSIEAQLAAESHGVLFVPMSFFSLTSQMEKTARLSFSNGSADTIAEGVRRFAAFVRALLAA